MSVGTALAGQGKRRIELLSSRETRLGRGVEETRDPTVSHQTRAVYVFVIFYGSGPSEQPPPPSSRHHSVRVCCFSIGKSLLPSSHATGPSARSSSELRNCAVLARVSRCKEGEARGTKDVGSLTALSPLDGDPSRNSHTKTSTRRLERP